MFKFNNKKNSVIVSREHVLVYNGFTWGYRCLEGTQEELEQGVTAFDKFLDCVNVNGRDNVLRYRSAESAKSHMRKYNK